MSTKEEYEEQQKTLRKKLLIPKGKEGYCPKAEDLVFTIDIQYENDTAFVALDVMNWDDEKKPKILLCREENPAEYQSGFFAFREGPLVLQAIEKAIAHLGKKPALLILDGHGTAHPRRLGLASWVGISLGIPAIGVAKRSLLRFPVTLDEAAGSKMEIAEEGELIGYVLRSVSGVKPIFVSAGNLISQENALDTIKSLTGSYRNIEPIRRADQAARKFAKGEQNEDMILL